jgi:hypothetical protein
MHRLILYTNKHLSHETHYISLETTEKYDDNSYTARAHKQEDIIFSLGWWLRSWLRDVKSVEVDLIRLGQGIKSDTTIMLWSTAQ